MTQDSVTHMQQAITTLQIFAYSRRVKGLSKNYRGVTSLQWKTNTKNLNECIRAWTIRITIRSDSSRHLTTRMGPLSTVDRECKCVLLSRVIWQTFKTKMESRNMFHAIHDLHFITQNSTMTTHSIVRARDLSMKGRIITKRVASAVEMAGIGLCALILTQNHLSVPGQMRNDSTPTRAAIFILMQTIHLIQKM